ncbi:head-tail connector protein [Lactobacillus mulieris]|uniref:head-tail connector protein n=1 Tax=Lactobacillus mulieris TaxID=2508708 RepID=UPI00224452B3|nr:head-tail connector protein [Lactobacillus mulieris]MCW8106149.1 head-tail connector protein [Lactobacillus mulieris]MCZ3741096.1 head-tail connector protein [Lactobacillus mulieris]MCZ3744815.1 head-tail connector protein [Lactobacillus mulieris]MCZ3747934.1 head-tail connector protein [Lactobacillus mulieris]MCZ3749274.1 head-tail connector protein [Lactobacillus mulieris]
MDLTEFKNYLRVDFDDDDSVIEAYYTGAENYICLAIGKNVKPTDLEQYEQFKPATLLLGAFWYNAKMAVQQTATVKANTDEIPFGVSALITQLKARYWEDYVAKQNESTHSNNEEDKSENSAGRLEISNGSSEEAMG